MPNKSEDRDTTTVALQPTTVLSRELIAAYEITEFQVLSPQPFTLRIGEKSNDLSAVYGEFGTATAGFITAWNPFSEETPDAINAANQAALINGIDRLGLSWWEGTGVDPNNDWTGEPSIFVLGISHDQAVSLGVRFGQNAIVWAGSDAIPRLVLLR